MEPKLPAQLPGTWQDHSKSGAGFFHSIQYRCGFCVRNVASERGWQTRSSYIPSIRICPNCNRPTFFEDNLQYPDVPIGEPVEHVPPDIETLYNEARVSAGANAPTASVLALRKLLMNIAVNKGASSNQSFQEYVDYLAAKGYVSPDSKKWVDHIRTKGNEANHEIALMKPSDAKDLIAFAEMLLKTIYEFPMRVPAIP